VGILIDFKEARAALSVGPQTVTEDLNDAVEAFAFAQLPKRNRIALVLAGVYGGEAEAQLAQADEISYYMQADFTIPYKAPKPMTEATIEEIIS
jgi:hypothetical protein